MGSGVSRLVNSLLNLTFHLPHGHSLCRGFLGKLRLHLFIRKTKNRPGVAHGETLFRDKQLDGLWKPEQPEKVGNGGAVFAGALTYLFVTEFQALSQAVQGLGDFDWIEVFALYVFDESDFEDAIIGVFLDHHRDFVEFSHAGGSPAALTGYQYVA